MIVLVFLGCTLRNKSDLFQVFTVFKTLVETQFEGKIKVFQSDGGGEFVNNQMKQFLQEHEIVHRLSCHTRTKWPG